MNFSFPGCLSSFYMSNYLPHQYGRLFLVVLCLLSTLQGSVAPTGIQALLVLHSFTHSCIHSFIPQTSAEHWSRHQACSAVNTTNAPWSPEPTSQGSRDGADGERRRRAEVRVSESERACASVSVPLQKVPPWSNRHLLPSPQPLPPSTILRAQSWAGLTREVCPRGWLS